MDDALRLIGLARKGGRAEVGEEPAGAAARAGKARLIVAAADAADHTLRRAAHFAQEGNAPLIQCSASKTELGAAVGRSSCALLAFTDAGLAAAFAAKLAAADPERYGAAAGQLAEKAQKILRRQREKRQQERELQKAANRPWAAPPRTRERTAAGKRERRAGEESGHPAPHRTKQRRKGTRKGGKRGGGRQVT